MPGEIARQQRKALSFRPFRVRKEGLALVGGYKGFS